MHARLYDIISGLINWVSDFIHILLTVTSTHAKEFSGGQASDPDAYSCLVSHAPPRLYFLFSCSLSNKNALFLFLK